MKKMIYDVLNEMSECYEQSILFNGEVYLNPLETVMWLKLKASSGNTRRIMLRYHN